MNQVLHHVLSSGHSQSLQYKHFNLNFFTNKVDIPEEKQNWF